MHMLAHHHPNINRDGLSTLRVDIIRVMHVIDHMYVCACVSIMYTQTYMAACG